jgi:20S proteasome alpha/beta subunit
MYKENMNEEEGIVLAIRAIIAGKKRDIFSGGKSISVMVISKKGIRELPESEVKKITEKEKIGTAN